jgi:c-di-GMP-binding flagellar brake protein YcgR
MPNSERVDHKRGLNKRREHRHTLALDTEVHFSEWMLEGMFRCQTENISLGGTYLPAQDLPISQETDVELIFHAGTEERKSYHLRAEVVRTDDEGAGLRFPELDSQESLAFRRFLLEAKIAARH